VILSSFNICVFVRCCCLTHFHVNVQYNPFPALIKSNTHVLITYLRTTKRSIVLAIEQRHAVLVIHRFMITAYNLRNTHWCNLICVVRMLYIKLQLVIVVVLPSNSVSLSMMMYYLIHESSCNCLAQWFHWTFKCASKKPFQ